MKTILVMEMPENCEECPCGTSCGDYCQAQEQEIGTFDDSYIDGQYTKPDWCPLKPIPERKMELGNQSFYMGEYTQSIEVPIPENKGWNACIDAIEGSGNDGQYS